MSYLSQSHDWIYSSRIERSVGQRSHSGVKFWWLVVIEKMGGVSVYTAESFHVKTSKSVYECGHELEIYKSE